MEFLTFEDRRQAALVNTVWNYATLRPVFTKNEQFVFKAKTNDDTSSTTQLYNTFVQTLSKTKRDLINLNLEMNGLSENLNEVSLFTNLGARIKSLELKNLSTLSDLSLDSITTSCCNLESLNLSLIDLSITDKSRLPLLRLKQIYFFGVTMSDKTFNILMKYLPNITNIGFCGCPVVMWHQTINRFYPLSEYRGISTNFNSDHVFTIVNIIHYLSTAKNINILKLDQCPHILLKLPKDIKLNYLSLGDMHAACAPKLLRSQTQFKSLVSALSEHTTLQKLDIVCCPCFLLNAVTKLINLKHLSLNCYSDIHSECISDVQATFQQFFSSLSNLKHIKKFSFIDLTNDNYENGTYAIPEYTLKSLTFLRSPIDNLSNILKFGGNLTKLTIENGKVITENDLVLLFKNLTALRHLSIYDCINFSDLVMMNSSISNLKGKNKNKIICIQIFLLNHNYFRTDTFRNFWFKTFISMFALY